VSGLSSSACLGVPARRLWACPTTMTVRHHGSVRTAVAPTRRGTWWFTDTHKLRLVEVDRSGEYLRHLRTPGPHMDASLLHGLDDGAMWAPSGRSGRNGLWTADEEGPALRADLDYPDTLGWTDNDGRAAYGPANDGRSYRLHVTADGPEVESGQWWRTRDGRRFLLVAGDAYRLNATCRPPPPGTPGSREGSTSSWRQPSAPCRPASTAAAARPDQPPARKRLALPSGEDVSAVVWRGSRARHTSATSTSTAYDCCSRSVSTGAPSPGRLRLPPRSEVAHHAWWRRATKAVSLSRDVRRRARHREERTRRRHAKPA
jgi:hypothetical protein